MTAIDPNLPGSEIVSAGLDDLTRGVTSEASLLVEMAAPRLRRLGYDVPTSSADAGHRLYALLGEQDPDPYSRYRAGIRRIVSFAAAAEHASTR